MAEEVSGITNEVQIQHFQFSGLSFSDTMFNLLVESWEETCQEMFQTNLQPIKNETKKRILSLPFRQRNFTEIFSLITRHCVTTLFNIPTTVTLPVFKTMQEGFETMSQGKKSVRDFDKEFKEHLDEIRSLRMELAENNEKIDEYRECINVLREMEKAQEGLIRVRQDPQNLDDKQTLSPV